MLIAVYGTLRKGEYNHRRCINADFIVRERINGLAMYNLGSYPCVIERPGSVVIEVYDVDTDIFNGVASMEQGAGYKIIAVNTSMGPAILFVMDSWDINISKLEAIEKGDWVEYINERRERGQREITVQSNSGS